jgi:hypothetical protein
MANREFHALSEGHKRHVIAMIRKARETTGIVKRECVEENSECYAYNRGDQGTSWGVNSSLGVNIARGLFPTGKPHDDYLYDHISYDEYSRLLKEQE